MKKIFWGQQTLLISLLLLQFACRDKCEERLANGAEFRVYEVYSFAETESIEERPKEIVLEIEEDTFMVENYITFEALEPNAYSYEWKIGQDDRIRTDKKFTLFFREQDLALNEKIDIQLIVRREPNTKCNPKDDGIDTLRKAIRLLKNDYCPLIGKYYGFDNSDPSHYYTIEVEYLYSPLYFTNVFSIKNLPGKCEKILPSNLENITAFNSKISPTYIRPQDIYPSCVFGEFLKNNIQLKEDRNKILIDYYFLSGSIFNYNTLNHRIFTGTRIP